MTAAVFLLGFAVGLLFGVSWNWVWDLWDWSRRK